jgi:multidrug efflux pump subunit AcrA (membrane-fusion protein)
MNRDHHDLGQCQLGPKPARLLRRRQGLFRLRPAAALVLMIFFLVAFGACRKNKSSSENAPLESGLEVKAAKPSRIIGLGRIEPELRLLTLSSEVQGAVVRINAPAGSRVAKGQAIIELTRAVEEARLDQATARRKAQSYEVESARASLAASRIRAENAALALERAKKLYEGNAQAKVTYDNAQAEYAALQEEVKRLAAEMAASQNLLLQSQADLKLARALLDQRFIRAPADGQVLSLDVTPGSLITPGTDFGIFAPLSPLTVWCEVDELFASWIIPGQKVVIRAQGASEELARGTVSFVGPFLRKKSIFSDEVGDLQDRRVREVQVKVEAGTGAGLLLGSRVECVIMVGD